MQICMKSQNMFPRENIVNFSSAELPHLTLKVPITAIVV